MRIIARSGGAAGGTVFPFFPYDPTRAVNSNALYVNSSLGNDSNSGLDLAHQKATFSGACSALGSLSTSSKRTIYFTGNVTYAFATDYALPTSGSSTSPIEVTSYPGDQPVLDFSAFPHVASGGGKPIQVDGVSWWQFNHLACTDWGQAVWFVGENNPSTTHDISWFCCYGTNSLGYDDNSGMMFMYDAGTMNNLTVDRVRLLYTGPTGVGHTNVAGIYWKRTAPSTGNLLDHFEIRGFPIGVYHKHGEKNGTTPAGNAIMRNGIIAQVTRNPAGYNPQGWYYKDIVFAGMQVRLADDDGGVAGDFNTYEHCTFYDGIDLTSATTTGDTQPGAQNIKFLSCIIRTQLVVETSSTVTSTSDYNLFSTGASAIVRYGSNNTLSQWQSNNSSDAHSAQVDPTFVGGADASLINFYALAPGSAGKNAANDGTDMGARTQFIGAQAA